MGQQYHPSAVRLLAEYEGELTRYVLPLVGGLDAARDVFQDTAVAILKKFDEYDAGKPFLPWAKQFARFEALMSIRRQKRHAFLCEELSRRLADHRDESDPPAQRKLEAMRACIARLPEPDRELIRLRYAAPGMTVQRLAEDTNQSAHCLYKALARIRKQLLDDIRRVMESADYDVG